MWQAPSWKEEARDRVRKFREKQNRELLRAERERKAAEARAIHNLNSEDGQ